MSIAMGNWTLKDWLEAAAYTVAIVGAIAGSIVFLANARKSSIETTRKDIVRTWTNEGDILSKETAFIDLKLENSDGDIIGTLESPRLDNPLDVSVDIGWGSSTLTVTELRGRSLIHVATVKIEVVGNHNRLKWRVTSPNVPSYLPRSSELWPNPVASAQ